MTAALVPAGEASLDESSSPTTFLNVAAASAGQGFRPQWIGPGLTSGLNTVAQVGCSAASSVDGAIFFSPFPQLDAIIARYSRLTRDYADASLIALADQTGVNVIATVDQRDFSVYRARKRKRFRIVLGS